MAVAIVGMGYAHALPISLQIVDFSAMEEPMEHMETVFYQREVLSFVCVTQVCGLASRRMFSMVFERSIVYLDPRAEILGVVIFGKWHAVSGCPLSVQCIFTMYIHCLSSHLFFIHILFSKHPQQKTVTLSENPHHTNVQQNFCFVVPQPEVGCKSALARK